MMWRRAGLAVVLAAAAVACASGDDATRPTNTSVTAAAAVATAPTTIPATTIPAATPASIAPAPTGASATTPPTAAPARTYDFSAVGPIVEAFVAERGLNGAGLVIVDREDGVVHEEYWGEFSADRVSFVASSSKMVTAGVLLRLHDAGLLDVDTPIADYVDWGAGNPDVTVAQLLSGSSGLVGLLPNPGYRPYICQFLVDGDIEDCGAAIFMTPDDDTDIAPPDTEFRYGGGSWQVAGALAEAVSGKPWAQLVDEIYAQPCGLTSTGYNNHFTQIGTNGFDYPNAFDGDVSLLAVTDNPNMEGGMYTTTGDYARLLLMHLRGGMCDGGRVLSQEALDTMHADRIGEVYGGSSLPGSGYGMGWWIDRATGRITDPGAYGSVPWLDLADGHGGYLVIESDSATGTALAAQLYDPVEQAILTARG
jgi:CubicO group peptidase (beta-lactamase class C family)